MRRQQRSRSKSEKISDILRSIHNRNRTGTKTSQIMYETYLPYIQLKEYLAMMIQHNLIVYIKEEKTFKITEYGTHVHNLYNEMDKLLVTRDPELSRL